MSRNRIIGILIGVAISLLSSLLYMSGLFAAWQDRLSDSLFFPRPARQDIAIIAIDDKSIQAIGRFPWNRIVYGQLLEKLGSAPAVVAIDVSFPEASSKTDDKILAEAFKKSGHVILPVEAGTLESAIDSVIARELLVPIPEFQNVTTAGLVNTSVDHDGINRRIPITIETTDESVLKSFSQQSLLLYLQRKNRTPLPPALAEQGYMRVNFVGGPKTFRTYSFVDVLKGSVSADTFQDAIVLIGATALDLHDNQLTPTSAGTPMSGVEIHANAIQTMMDQKFLREEPSRQTIVTIVAIVIALSLVLSFFGILAGTVTGIAVLLLFIRYAIFSFDHGIIVNLVFPPLAIFLVYVSTVMYKYVAENKQKRFIKKALSFYLSKSVMRDVLKNPKKLSLGGDRKDITVLFSDIAGFTTISEKLPPEQLSQLLNRYLTRMTNLVFHYNGVLDKYIGDAVMAFWGAPVPDADQAFHACQTALAMQQEIDQLRLEWKAQGILNFSARVGINSGEMVVGNMGSDVRFDYTLLGDNVNLGSRLEGINKEYGTSIIISGSTYEQVRDRVIARKLDTVAVKGKKQGVMIYELRSMDKANTTEQQFLDQFETARALYEQGKFTVALKQFSHLAIQHAHDMPTNMYIDRCKELMNHPPKEWDGVFHAKSK